MEKKAQNTIRKYNMLKKGDKILVGLSGGSDSVVLLHFLASIAKENELFISIIHINHNLRGLESKEDELFCTKLAKKYSIPIEIFSIDAKKEAQTSKKSIEEISRELRYKILHNELKKQEFNKIAIAHNKNDSIETAIFNIFRGSGGVLGIKPINGQIIRPLIDVYKSEILEYINQHNLEYKTDSSNQENIYSRNKIRNMLLPIIKKEFNPNIEQTLARHIEINSEENSYLDTIAAKKLAELEANNALDIKGLISENIAIKRCIIRLYFKKHLGLKNISYSHIEAVLGLLGKKSGSKISLFGAVVANNFGKLQIENKNQPTEDFSYELKIGERLFVPNINKWFYLSNQPLDIKNSEIYQLCKPVSSLTIRNKQAGDKIRINNINKSVKKLLVEKKIPRNVRQRLVFVANQSDVIMILGQVKSDAISSKEKGEFLIQIWEEKND